MPFGLLGEGVSEGNSATEGAEARESDAGVANGSMCDPECVDDGFGVYDQTNGEAAARTAILTGMRLPNTALLRARVPPSPSAQAPAMSRMGRPLHLRSPAAGLRSTAQTLMLFKLFSPSLVFLSWVWPLTVTFADNIHHFVVLCCAHGSHQVGSGGAPGHWMPRGLWLNMGSGFGLSDAARFDHAAPLTKVCAAWESITGWFANRREVAQSTGADRASWRSSP